MKNLQIIEQALNLAVTKGAFSLQEIDAIINALKELSLQTKKCEQQCQKECKNE